MIGTTFGEGDEETTFNLPDLRGEFIRGWDNGRGIDTERIFGSLQEDAIRNITGSISAGFNDAPTSNTGAFFGATANGTYSGGSVTHHRSYFDASKVVPTANENRPRNIALLACIKAFDATTNPGLIDITRLANEVAAHKQVTKTYDDGTNWYRKWSDGWVEQGGLVKSNSSGIANLLVALSGNYYVIANQRPYSNLDTRAVVTCAANDSTTFKLDALSINAVSTRQALDCNFYACGKEFK